MERLNLLVVQSDLQLVLEDLNNGAPATPVQGKQPALPNNGPTKVVLKLNVSLYGRALRPTTAPKSTLAAPG